MKPVIFLDMDGVVAGFAEHYEKLFFRSAYNDDGFTVIQAVRTVPDFFRNLSVIPKGLELFEILNDDYTIVFLTSPVDENELCRVHKLEWVHEHFGTEYDVIFAKDKSVYVEDEKSILIDDMKHNLDAWADAGGTAIDIKNRIDDICEHIEEAIYGKKEIETIKEKLKKIVVTEPTEKQAISGVYKKGEIEIKGLKIKIENTPGSIRWGFDEENRKWISKIHDFYGYITGTIGNDNEPVDIFINPDGVSRSLCFVINQMSKGIFDEQKVMLGYDDEEQAKKAYLRNYRKGQENNIHSIVRTNTKKLRLWLKKGNYTEPFKEDIK
jgi:5'(3')-deoxyribonucleotidase